MVWSGSQESRQDLLGIRPLEPHWLDTGLTESLSAGSSTCHHSCWVTASPSTDHSLNVVFGKEDAYLQELYGSEIH